MWDLLSTFYKPSSFVALCTLAFRSKGPFPALPQAATCLRLGLASGHHEVWQTGKQSNVVHKEQEHRSFYSTNSTDVNSG